MLFRRVKTAPGYLTPYVRAARRHGAAFEALLWASPATQEARFDALVRACDFAGKSVLDAGCGRADFLEFLVRRGVRIGQYVGLEALAPLAAASRRQANARIVHGDFVADPRRLFVGADVVVFCGSLNTLSETQFYATLRLAFDAAAQAVAFNFLDSPRLAGSEYLTWHLPEKVLEFAGALPGQPQVRSLADYLEGDRTVAVLKQRADGKERR